MHFDNNTTCRPHFYRGVSCSLSYYHPLTFIFDSFISMIPIILFLSCEGLTTANDVRFRIPTRFVHYRFAQVVFFVPFSAEERLALAEAELRRWAETAERRHGLALSWTRAAAELLAAGYQAQYGARSVLHEVQRRAVSLLATAHERGLVPRGSRLLLDADGKALRLAIGRDPDSDHWRTVLREER